MTADKRSTNKAKRRRDKQRATQRAIRAERGLVPPDDPAELRKHIVAMKKDAESRKRCAVMEDEMMAFFRDEDAEPNEVFNVCILVAARQAMHGQRGKLWFLKQANAVWNAQAKTHGKALKKSRKRDFKPAKK